MRLTHLEADRIRNLKQISLPLASGLTIVAGRNGQGKTSLLEAVHVLATGRSFRTRRLDEAVAWEGGPLRVAGRCSGRAGEIDLAVLVGDSGRHLMANGVERDLGSYLGRLDVIDLTAERMEALRGEPAERRRFLDRGIVGLRPARVRLLAEYRRVLGQRNALLRRATRLDGAVVAQIEVWDQRLCETGGALHGERRRYAERLGSQLAALAADLSVGAEEVAVQYRPSPAEAAVEPPDRFPDVLSRSLERGRGRDVELGHTAVGPHRDDLAIELQGVDLRRFGSAGQVRASMIALKLAKMVLLREERGEAPLFLMDDFDSDLDEVRMSAVADALHHGGFQSLLASSKEAPLARMGVPFTKLRVDGGAARAA
jgi:DNA replication and repair protein RecF